MDVERRSGDPPRGGYHQIRAFCTAARFGSITRAAQHLGRSQPAVSTSIRGLEHEYQEALFERRAGGLALTEAGERLYALAGPLVEGIEGLFAHFGERAEEYLAGRVDIATGGVGAAFVLPPYLRRFRDRYPGVRVRVMDRPLGEGMALLRAGEVEFVLGASEPLEEVSMHYREMLRYDIVLITALDHALAGRVSVTPQEAAQWPMIAPPAGTYSRQVGETAAKRLGVDARAVIEVRGWGVIKRYVERGLGVSVVPSICVHETDRVSVVSLDDAFPARSFGVYTRRSRVLTAPARRLLELMIPGFALRSPGAVTRGGRRLRVGSTR